MAERILDFSQPLDVALLDEVVTTMYDASPSNSDNREKAHLLLNQFKESPEAWTRVDAILEGSTVPVTRMFALSILDETIKYRWRLLPRERCEEIKNYIVNMIISVSSDFESLEANRLWLSKLNATFVQIIKQEWPTHWQRFIPDLVGASKANAAICENNMHILLMLSEEVFEFSKGQLTQSKIRELKEQFTQEFSLVYQLCEFVLNSAERASLLHVTLETLLRFLSWIPLAYVFDTPLIDTLLNKFLVAPETRNVATQCATEIAALTVGPSHDHSFVNLFTTFIERVQAIIPLDTDIASAYETGDSDEMEFVKYLAVFLATFFRSHRGLIEVDGLFDQLIDGHRYLCELSLVDDEEIFKVCLEYWHSLTHDLYGELGSSHMTASQPLLLGNNAGRRAAYVPILSQVRLIMISRMAKPKEVLIVQDPDTGEIIKEEGADTGAVALYQTMKETLVYLTHLDFEDTHRLMQSKLARQMDGSEWSFDRLNTLCWAIGSISGACSEEYEKRFLVNVIKDLLLLCENKRGKARKAVVASDIMYVVGQYPRFLRAHWKFLKTVVKKLFEFMHELHEGVQDMACETFILIAKECRRKFVVKQHGDTRPFVEDILEGLPREVALLKAHQVHMFYKAVGYMIFSLTDSQRREQLIEQLMVLPNRAWQNVMSAAQQDVDTLRNNTTVQSVIHVLKTNTAVCTAVGNSFTTQLGAHCMDMLNVYRVYSQAVSQAAESDGEYASTQSRVRLMKQTRREVLRLLETYVEKAADLQLLKHSFLAPIMDACISEFVASVPLARDHAVYLLLTAMVARLQEEACDAVPGMLDGLMAPTLEMITTDFNSFLEVRRAYFKFLHALVKYAFASLFMVPPDTFKLIIDSILFAAKHEERSISELGLEALLLLLQRLQEDEQVAGQFYASFATGILQDVLAILTDTMHKSGFKLQAAILQHLFRVLPSAAPISEEGADNTEYIGAHVSELLASSFPNLHGDQVRVVVKGMFAYNEDLTQFKEHLRDFLVMMKEFSADGVADLYLEEKEKEIEREQQEKESVPGLVALDDGMADVDVPDQGADIFL